MPKEYCQLCCFHCLCSYRVVYLLVGGLAVWGLVGAALSPATRDPRNQADVAKRQPANPLQEVRGGGWGGGGGGGGLEENHGGLAEGKSGCKGSCGAVVQHGGASQQGTIVHAPQGTWDFLSSHCHTLPPHAPAAPPLPGPERGADRPRGHAG